MHWLFSSRRGPSPRPLPASRGEGERLQSFEPNPKGRPLKLAVVLFAALFVGGCSVSKWTVKPHQRELLADRIMQLDAQQQERMAEEHVLSNREGAIGGTGTAGGGCGCN